ncbi:MAG TPA: hypothetical protein VFA64_09190 [Hyphomicrobiaceae bacterium]|nr:hypothetical protein [Hyphomicrobiaceae bacterium]
MRARVFLAAAAGALGLAFAQPAAAGGWDDGYCCEGGYVYVHHHVYYPPRYRHVYHAHVPGPRHINVVHYPVYDYGCCGPWFRRLGYGYPGYFAAPYYYRWHWRARRHW